MLANTKIGTVARKTLSLLCAGAISLTSFSGVVLGAPGQSLREKFSDTMTEVAEVESTDEYYYYIRQEYEQKGYKPVKDVSVDINVLNPSQVSDASLSYVNTGLSEDGVPVLEWNEGMEWFEWNIDVAQEGLYELQVEYLPLDGKGTTIQRSISIDGETPYTEAYNLPFNRKWRDIGEITINNVGDQVRPKQAEIREWRTISACDTEGYYSEPLQFYLSAGQHTIKMEYVDEPMAIKSIAFIAPHTYKTYAEVKAEYEKNGYENGTDQIKFQAEETSWKSDQILRREYDSDPLCEPTDRDSKLLNVVGGNNWKYGNQEISWSFDIETAGLYQITMRLGQWWNDRLPSYRTIKIDGEVPFKELQEYSFDYVLDFQLITLGNEEEPYLFYFTPGTHTITMVATLGPMTEVAQEVMNYTLKISELYRKIVMVTGREPDTNYEYQLEKTIPNLLEDFQDISDSLEVMGEYLTSLCTKKPSIANNFDTIRAQLNTMIKRPDSIPGRLDDLYNAQTSLGDYINTLKTQYLLIDYFIIGPEGQEMPKYKSGILKKMVYTWYNFLSSFTKDYDSVGNVYTAEEGSNQRPLSVWISRGEEWAELIKRLADEDFSEETGIRINMNILPAGQLSAGAVNALMLAITSGRAPDVATGVDSNSPVEFAIRGSSASLSEFENYEEVESRFNKTLMIPFKYNGKTYALPDQIGFNVLIYRKDILGELGVKIPDTWEELYTKVLPVLYQNGMEFMPTVFQTFLYQNGGQYYTEDGMQSALDSPEAYVGFKEWTDQYVSYGMPIEANFFNRFRTGEMPIGIVGYDDYIKITTAAPELFGRWDIALVPGHKKEDGTIDRSIGAIASTSTMILEGSDMKEEAWQFLDWWSSADVQTQFGRELEALLGIEARWNSANTEAFENSNWTRNHKKIILEQLTWAKEQPVVLGGYYTARHVTNAWTRVVTSNQIPRDSLEEAVKEINKELRAKQEEYGAIED